MKILLVLLVVALLVPDVAMAARWEKGMVRVWDFTPDEWRGDVQAMVDAHNALMPPDVPRLVYVPMGELPCGQLPSYGKKGGISVCLASMPSRDHQSLSKRITVGRTITQAKMMMDPQSGWPRRHDLCHEAMHAITDIPDDYALPHRDESCVHGAVNGLGPWDLAYAESVYSHDSGPRHRAGGQDHRAKRRRA